MCNQSHMESKLLFIFLWHFYFLECILHIGNGHMALILLTLQIWPRGSWGNTNIGQSGEFQDVCFVLDFPWPCMPLSTSPPHWYWRPTGLCVFHPHPRPSTYHTGSVSFPISYSLCKVLDFPFWTCHSDGDTDLGLDQGQAHRAHYHNWSLGVADQFHVLIKVLY